MHVPHGDLAQAKKVGRMTQDHGLEISAYGLPKLTSVHLFYWRTPKDRRALAEGEAEWQRYLQLLGESPKRHPLLLAFVRNDDPDIFLHDAATLLGWLEGSLG